MANIDRRFLHLAGRNDGAKLGLSECHRTLHVPNECYPPHIMPCPVPLDMIVEESVHR